MTNEILSIVLYFVSGVVVASIAMAIYGMRNKINGLERQTREIDNTILSINKSIENLHREFDLVHQKLDTKSDKIYRTIHELNTGIYRYVDSRYDKLENKLIDIVKNGCEPVKSK